MKQAEHIMLSVQTAIQRAAHSISPANYGTHYRYSHIPQKISKSNSLFTKTLPSRLIHSCMNNRRTLSQKTWIFQSGRVFEPNFTSRNSNESLGTETLCAGGLGQAKPFFNCPIMEKKI